MKLVRGLSSLSQLANHLIETIDWKDHARMRKLRKAIVEDRDDVAAIWSQDPSLHLTLEVIVNRQSGPRKATSHAKNGRAVMFPLGNFEGGDLEPEEQGLVGRLQPGDVVVLRAREVRRAIRQWKGSLHMIVVYYSTESVDKQYRM